MHIYMGVGWGLSAKDASALERLGSTHKGATPKVNDPVRIHGGGQ